MSTSTNSLQKKYGFVNFFKPDPLVKKAIRYTKGGNRLLDIGCGEGADSAYYAKKGFQVKAIDLNKEDLKRFRAYRRDHELHNITIRNCDVISYRYPKNYYDVIISFLVGCCMRRSEFEKMLISVKQAIKPGGVIIMSLRNYLDHEYTDAISESRKMIEPNTFKSIKNCCVIRYYIEKGRLLELFNDFEILYYFEGIVPSKYPDEPDHGDSYIICRGKNLS